ncbi:MAG: hypothetical protein HZA12_01315 [Nitrospirae bacterium]|nr:hypothetical protein [Nitrospirota bacterium]
MTARKAMPAADAIPPPFIAKNQKWLTIVITAARYNHKPHFASLTLYNDVSNITGISWVIAPLMIMVAHPRTAIWAKDKSLGWKWKPDIYLELMSIKPFKNMKVMVAIIKYCRTTLNGGVYGVVMLP